MGTLTLTPAAISKNTYIIDGVVANQDGESQVPTSLTWTMTDEYGNVLNARENVAISPPTAEFHIVLTGDDLDEELSLTRIVTVTGVYDSDVYGSGLSVRAQGQFTLGDWVEPEIIT